MPVASMSPLGNNRSVRSIVPWISQIVAWKEHRILGNVEGSTRFLNCACQDDREVGSSSKSTGMLLVILTAVYEM